MDREILSGLDSVPTPNYPGCLLIDDVSQAVLIGKYSDEIVIAAARFQPNGKILVTAHDCYLNWLESPDSEIKKKFNKNIKLWLTGQDIPFREIVDFEFAASKSKSFSEYKMIKWHHNFDPSENDVKRLINWLKQGGGLLCGSTPWGYLQIYPTRSLEDMGLNRFLKKYAGITFSPDVLRFPDYVNVSFKTNPSNRSYLVDENYRSTNKTEKMNNNLDFIERGFEILKLDEKIENKSELRKILNEINFEKKPIKDANLKKSLKIIEKCFRCVNGAKAPCINQFPGDFEEIPKLLDNVLIKVKTKFDELISTGYYLPAGESIKIEIDSNFNDNWEIQIGAHTDNNSACDSFERWPCVIVSKKLSKRMNFSSPFGGLIFIKSIEAGEIDIRLSNVVQSPYFDLTKSETVKNWKHNKNAPGLWAELAGENIIFTTPSSCIRHIEDPTEVLKFWDKVVKTHHECRGTDCRNYKRERVVSDKQPVVGYMHSGYPIVTCLDCCQKEAEECIFDLEKLMKNGNWGLFHELGHNMQRDEWTFRGTVEVTVNIFSLHATYKLIGQDILDQKWPRNQMSKFENYFSKQPNTKDFEREVGMALMLFIQLIKHFGWKSMYTFMKNYEEDIQNCENLPKSYQEKVDQWVIRYSKIVAKNIKPQFEMFGLKVSEQVNNQLRGLKTWCPVEEKNADRFFKKL